MKNQLQNIIILPNTDLSYQREANLAHTSYLTECAFYSLIQQGDVQKACAALRELLDNKLVVGKLSADKLRQMKYWAVCCITLGTRYAIQGGLDEMTAFNMSDDYIQKIDAVKSEAPIIDVLENAVKELTESVKQKSAARCSAKIKACINYIQLHLHEKITLTDLSKALSISADHLSKLFKSETGCTLHKYVITQKLEAAKAMINGDTKLSTLPFILGFSSQSHFIQCFKAEYGLTPTAYMKAKGLN